MPAGPAHRIGVDLWYAQAPHSNTSVPPKEDTEGGVQYTLCAVCGHSENRSKNL
jgi:CDGSH-type Zn-finger protein